MLEQVFETCAARTSGWLESGHKQVLYVHESFRLAYAEFVARFGMAELRDRALAAVDEAADRATKEPVQRTLALRFTLAFLANFADERWPFDNFWRAIATEDEKVRGATVIAALNAIRRTVVVGKSNADADRR